MTRFMALTLGMDPLATMRWNRMHCEVWWTWPGLGV
jgi:hypothetical protein